MKIGEEASDHTAVMPMCAGAQGRCESPDMGVKNLLEMRGWSIRTRDVPTATGPRRKILGKDEMGWRSVLLPGKLAEQAPESREVQAARFVGQGRMLISEAANPTEEMGIAAQL